MSWRVVVTRSVLGFAGGLVSGLAVFSTIGGAIAYAISNQEHGTSLAWAFHGAYAGLNLLAGWFLLAMLADEERPVLPTVLVWASGTAALIGAYWSWVL